MDLESGEFLKYRPPDFHVLTTIDKKQKNSFVNPFLEAFWVYLLKNIIVYPLAITILKVRWYTIPVTE